MKTICMQFDCYGVPYGTHSIRSNEVIIFNSESVSDLKNIAIDTRLVITKNVKLSSHFFNVLRYYCDYHKIILLIANEEILNFIQEGKSFTISKNELVVNDGENGVIVIRRESVGEKFNDIIELNCKSSSVCLRPQKSYNSTVGELIVDSQREEGLLTELRDGRLWINFEKSLPQIVADMIENDSERYSEKLLCFLNTIKSVISSNEMERKREEELVYQLYRFSPYVGYYVNIISSRVYARSQEAYDEIALEAAKQYNLNMDDVQALKTVNLLIDLLGNIESMKSFVNELTNGKCYSNYEAFLFVVSIMSDLRRRAVYIIENRGGIL
ncbi:MAG: hypothetical protein J6B29_00255 [Clostridia bacterium]|nr:hypothetical protein [Clostridia bacterium]